MITSNTKSRAAIVVADVPVQIHQRADERDDDQSEQNHVKHRNHLRVLFITLLFHHLRPSSGPPGDYSRKSPRRNCRLKLT